MEQESARLKGRDGVELGGLVFAEVVGMRLQDCHTTMFDWLRMSPRAFVDKLIKDVLLGPKNDSAIPLAPQEVIEVVIEGATQIAAKPDV